MILRQAEVGEELRTAFFSEDMIFRYRLDICWDPALPTMTTIALNPSTADEMKDDPTIRRGKAFARAWGCGAYRMLNAFALRSTDYKGLFRVADPIGPDNSIELIRQWCTDTLTIACWGSHITSRKWKHYYRGKDIAERIPDLYALRISANGHPVHPLYLPADLKPVPFRYQ